MMMEIWGRHNALSLAQAYVQAERFEEAERAATRIENAAGPIPPRAMMFLSSAFPPYNAAWL
jgi:hypothetical protein